MKKKWWLFFIFLSLSACKKEKTSLDNKKPILVVYSGRSKSLVAPILDAFQKKYKTRVLVKYGSTSQLALLLQQEMKWKKSPASLFWAQDAGALSLLAEQKTFATLPSSLLKKLPAVFRGKNDHWLPISGRIRVLAYSTKRVKTEELPKSLFDLTLPRWKEKVGWAPSNASFQSFVTAMRKQHGEEKTEQWLLAMKNNGTKVYPKNSPQIRALASGEIDLALPNHYYLFQFLKKDPKYPVAQTFFKDGSVGNLINVAGVGLLKTAPQRQEALQLIEFLLSKEIQQDLASRVFEYPLVQGISFHPSLPSLEGLRQKNTKLSLEALKDLPGTLQLLKKVGLI